MANVKTRSRVKSDKASKPVHVRKGKTASRNSPKRKDVEMTASRKQKAVPAKDKSTMYTTGKVAHLLQNSYLFRDKFVSQNIPVVNGRINKDKLKLKKTCLVTENGLIKHKTKQSLSLINKILKSELLIDPKRSSTKQKQTKKSVAQYQNNNNNEPANIEIGFGHGIINSNELCSAESTPEKLDKNCNKIKKSSKGKVKINISKKFQQKNNKKVDKSESKNGNIQNTIEPSKTKQVTLSNGVVLTLSLFQCDYCKRTFSHKSSLRRHIYVHLNVKPYVCIYCPKKFSQKTNLSTHISVVHDDIVSSTHVCNQCDKVFTLKENLTLHLATHVKSENEFRCLFCNKMFSHQLLLTNHEKQHLVAGKFQCSICKMSYDCRSRLSTHVKSHLNIKEYICQYCGKEFLRPNSIRRHIEISHGGFSVQCPICKKNLKGHLSEHMRLHDKKKPHECPDCGQRFTQSTQLTVHRRNHTGDKPYRCRICARPFAHSNAMLLHIRRHTGEKPFPCAMCHMAFSQLPHMKAHMKNIHGKLLPYKCKKCEQFFKKKSDIDEHIKSCTVGDSELSFEEKLQASVQVSEVESTMNISKMRFLLALLLTMIASETRLLILGFNKRLIDDILVESLEAMGQVPVRDETLSQLSRLKANIQTLLNETVPKDQMQKFREENKSTEELLELLTDDKYVHTFT